MFIVRYAAIYSSFQLYFFANFVVMSMCEDDSRSPSKEITIYIPQCKKIFVAHSETEVHVFFYNQRTPQTSRVFFVFDIYQSWLVSLITCRSYQHKFTFCFMELKAVNLHVSCLGDYKYLQNEKLPPELSLQDFVRKNGIIFSTRFVFLQLQRPTCSLTIFIINLKRSMLTNREITKVFS